MNGTQRILGTLAGTPVDRCAVAPILSLYGAKLTDCAPETYYRDPAAYARGQSAVMDRFDPDVIFGPFDFPSLGEAFGSKLHFFADQAPNVRRPAISNYTEWDHLHFPDPEAHPRLSYFTQAIRLMAERARGETLICACLPPVIDFPTVILGMEGWIDAVVSDQEAALRIMKSLMPWFKCVTRSLYAAGASVIAMPCAYASPAIVTREIATSLMRPVILEMLTDVGGPVIIHHGGAPIMAHLDILAGLPSVAGYFIDELDSLSEARRILGPDTTLLRGPEAPRLPGMSRAQVEAHCMASLATAEGKSRFVLGNSGPDVPWATPPENIDAIRNAASAMAAVTSP